MAASQIQTSIVMDQSEAALSAIEHLFAVMGFSIRDNNVIMGKKEAVLVDVRLMKDINAQNKSAKARYALYVEMVLSNLKKSATIRINWDVLTVK